MSRSRSAPTPERTPPAVPQREVSPLPQEQTLAFYEKNARRYIEATRELEIAREVYAPFEDRLAPGARLLDAGCGSGRDVRYFQQRGFEVAAMDASPELAREAERFLGIPVAAMRHQEVRAEREFDGIWACASLLHVPAGEMAMVLKRYARALKSGGVLYASYKVGEGERIDEQGRHFTDYTRESFTLLLEEVPELRMEECWLSGDTQARQGTLWLNAILREQSSPEVLQRVE